MQRETKKLIYKQAEGSGRKTLQDRLTSALKRFKKPKSRLEEMGTSGSEVRFVAYWRTSGPAITGVFHKLTKGRAQEVIDMNPDGDEWAVSLVSAKLGGKELSEFIEGTLFFQVWKNHVILHQTASCRSEHFEQHLSWLLDKHASDEADGGPVQATLIALVDPATKIVRRKSKTAVKKITIGAPLLTKPVSEKATSIKKYFTPTGDLWKGVQLIFGALNVELPEVRVDGSLADNDIRASLELFTSKKKSGLAAGEVLGVLGRQLSHSDAAYKTELADGSIITHEMVKVSREFRVDCSDRHPVHASLFKSMMEYMMALVDEEIIIESESFGNVK